jgi:adhesin transport system outer membrane protein
MYKTIIGSLFCLFFSSGLFSQRVLGLKELLERVAGNAPSLATDSMALRIREARLEAVNHNRIPSLKLNYQVDAGTNNNLPGGYFSYGIVPGNSRVRTEGNSSTALGDLGIAAFDWQLYDFGGFEAERKLARSDVQVEQSRFEQSKFELQAFSINSYIQLLRINDLLSIQSLNIERNTEIRRSIQSLAKSGIIAGVDTSIAESELSRARLSYLELSGQYKQIQLQLSAISGLRADTIIPDTSFAYQLIAYYTQKELPGTIVEDHPVIQYYKSLYANSLDRENLIRKSYNPKVSLQAAVWGRGSSISAADEFRELPKGIGFERGNYLVGLGISFNVFDLRRKKFQLNVQKANSEYALKALDEQQSQLSLRIQQTDAELEIARQRLLEIPRQLEAAKAAYRQKFSLYRNGLTNIVDLNVALNILYRAETDFTNANYAYLRALLQRAVNENQLEALLNTIK